MRFPQFTVAMLVVAGGIAVLAALDRVPTPSADRVPVGRPAFNPSPTSTSHVAVSQLKHPPTTPSRSARPALKRPLSASPRGERTYSSTSPHWTWIRTMVTDFRTGYVSNVSQRNAERAWAAAHFDFVMAGDAQTYKALNPGIRVIPYALDWNVMQPSEHESKGLGTAYYDDMQQWFATHPQYQLEKALLHTAGAEPTPETRIQFTAWGSKRWAMNPGDPGARAYLSDRIRRLTSDADGVFFDSHTSGVFGTTFGKLHIAEYPDQQAYQRDMVDYLHSVATAIAPKIVMINTSVYTRPFDFAMAVAAGAVHLERINNPLDAYMPDRWNWVDSLLAHNVIVELVSLDSWDEANGRHGQLATYTPGNYTSSAERLKMFELASYYMVVPASPDRLFLDLENAWKVPFDKVWLKAQEYSVGHPTSPRRVILTGQDSTGTGFKVWARDFDHALVLARPNGTWKNRNYGDGTAASVPLPDGQALRPLHGDGTLGTPVATVTLRAGEAMILIR